MIDRSRLLALVEKIRQLGFSSDTETVLTIEEFFEGNGEPYPSLCANTANPPSTPMLRDFFLAVRRKPEVRDLLIRVYEYDDAITYLDTWITSDTVYVITAASVSEVADWFAPLSPSAVCEETDYCRFNNMPTIPAGSRLVAVWWD